METETTIQQDFKRVNNGTLEVKANGKTVQVKLKDINFVKDEKDYVIIQTNIQEFTTPYTMKEMLALLPATIFIRVHHSYIVNLAKVAGYHCDTFYMKMDSVKRLIIPFDKDYIESIYEKWGAYLSARE